MAHTTLGIDVGSTNLKICVLEDGKVARTAILAHDGDVCGALVRILSDLGLADGAPGVKALVTGTEGRNRIALPGVIAPKALEAALGSLGLEARAVVSMGGEDLVVHALDGRGRISGTYSGNKCASGTGEFFRQQLGRMDLGLDEFDAAASCSSVHRLSARCSVFMKSDCTHRLNKGESTTGDIALSLTKVMADKVSEFLTKARIRDGRVVLVGGVTRNRFIVRFLAEAWADVEFVVPEQAPYFEAFGAALLAGAHGAPLPATQGLAAGESTLSYGTYPPLKSQDAKVRYMPSMRGAYDPDAEYILGVDGGSTTTKIALINSATLEIVAAHYGRTHGDPVGAVKECARRVIDQLGGKKPRITLLATTGSSRELLGVFLETAGVYNEIIAHTVGTTHFEPGVNTIFEIGGQDAKYVFINNSVPIDYAMNEACSAGTGSFLEESARGDLSIERAEDIGPIALEAQAPLKFGQHCSAFINSDIRKAISQGASREDIVAGLVFSIVANYLNRVVGNRAVGDRIALQGGVAKNPAVPLAFAQMTGKSIAVPPDPELMGCFGVALLARNKHAEGLLAKGDFSLEAILSREIVSRGTFTCRACENLCEIRNLEVMGHRYPFGGRCSKYTNARKKRRVDEDRVTDYTQVRTDMLFRDFAPDPAAFVARTDKVVGVPSAFSIHSLWPFYSWFFHTLGVRAELSKSISKEGIAKLESNYCFPAEIAHGAIEDCLDRKVDYVFLPHFRDMPSMEADPVHACVCPLTQGLPFFARQAFGLGDDRVLRPLVAFKHGWDESREAFEQVAVRLGFTRAEGAHAYGRGLAEYRRFLDAYKALGAQVLARIESDPDTIYVALLGRPYNAFTRDANMGIPRKFVSHGVTVVPFDMIFDPDDEIFPNMYWYYGQQNMKAVRKVRAHRNLYLTWISNFSCAPDSFMLHYVRWMMGHKPYLVLEIDSHSADAGLDTRVEAFLDIVESYRRVAGEAVARSFERRYRLEPKKEFVDIVDRRTGERIDIRDPRVTLVWPSMGDLATEASAVASRGQGIKSLHLPVPDVQSTQLARDVASGKECIPSLLVLGSVLKFLREHGVNRPDELFLVFIPSTLGPCRTGQYYVFYERLFEELGFDNVVILVGGSENSYREMGPTFTRDMWWALTLGDQFTDVRLGLRLMAVDVDAAMAVFERCWRSVLDAFAAGRAELEQALAQAGRELAAVPRRRSLEDLHKVLIVGEIYVRRDSFSVQEITDYLVSQDIFPKVTDITEWIRYTDFSRKYLMDAKQRREGLARSFGSGLLKEQAWFHVEKFYKDMVDHKVSRHLALTGLVPHAPHDMKLIIDNAKRHFIDPELETEATVSSGVAATAMADGYSGVAIIAPFACLPGRLIEGVYAPWARARGYPVLALENDGQPYPPNILSRMEVFAHNVLRFEKPS
jgi:predicted CoA-substrate-specific enzyme activase